MDAYDVIVVGAGPAGSIAGHTVAMAGFRVAVVERDRFPRDKICGDALSVRTLETLGNSGGIRERLLDKGLHRVYRNRTFFPDGKSVERRLSGKGSRIDFHVVIPRIEFDAMLAEELRRSGAELIEGFRARSLLGTNGSVSGIEGERDGRKAALSSRIVIAADGESSVSRTYLNKRRNDPGHLAIGLRAYFEGVEMDEGAAEHYFDAGIPFGYGWIFSLGRGRANVGVVTRYDAYRTLGRTLPGIFRGFVETNPHARKRLAGAARTGPMATRLLPLGTQAGTNHAAGLLVAGDAGSFIDPFTYEGIYSAVRTGKLAGETAVEALSHGDVSARFLAAYEQKWRRALAPAFRKRSLTSRVVHGSNRMGLYRLQPWVTLLKLGWK